LPLVTLDGLIPQAKACAAHNYKACSPVGRVQFPSLFITPQAAQVG